MSVLESIFGREAFAPSWQDDLKRACKDLKLNYEFVLPYGLPGDKEAEVLNAYAALRILVKWVRGGWEPNWNNAKPAEKKDEPAKTDEPATPAAPAEPSTDPNAEEIDKLKKECQNLSKRLTEMENNAVSTTGIVTGKRIGRKRCTSCPEKCKRQGGSEKCRLAKQSRDRRGAT